MENDEVFTNKRRAKKVGRLLALLAGLLALLAAAGVAFAYVGTPTAIRRPKFQHYHFRMQIVVEGRAVNFADKAFQQGYSKDSCNVDLAAEPVHFHDHKNQLTHVHWDGLTGGLVLKDYGWNYLGGSDRSLGYRFDKLPRISRVPIHGHVLPAVPQGAHFYIYSGDEHSHRARSWQDFLHTDLEQFFGKQSNLGSGEQSGWLRQLFPKAYAHDMPATAETATPENLEAINNLLGNVVIFVQKNPPTDQQITARFQQLTPLSLSTCGG